MNYLPENWQDELVRLALEAGKEIMQIYDHAFEVEHKEDGSPLTQADKNAHNCIVDGLAELTPDIPVISEESSQVDIRQSDAPRYWLVDPLDGTKEFVKRNGEFTVNIALIEANRPTWGVVHAPAKDLTYFGGEQFGSVKVSAGKGQTIQARQQQDSAMVFVVSRSHQSSGQTSTLYSALEANGQTVDHVVSGSSLKFCMIAEGEGDCYPRLGPTSEWDTAAAEAVLHGAGGEVIRFADGQPLDYNKEDILNPEFLACGKLNGTTRSLILNWYQSRSV